MVFSALCKRLKFPVTVPRLIVIESIALLIAVYAARDAVIEVYRVSVAEL